MSNVTLRLITQPSDTLHLMDIPYDTTYVAIRPRIEEPDQELNSEPNSVTTPTLTHYEIQVGPPTDFTKIWVMATYSTLKIATYVFDLMLQTAFDNEEMFFQFPTEDTILEFIEAEQELKQEQKQDNKYLN